MNKKSIMISISKDFTETPGARNITDGKYSGEEFRETILCPKFQEAVDSDGILCVDLDGCYGYATSFLEEAFGGLARKFGVEEVQKRIKIISHDEIGLEKDICRYIAEAKEKK